VPPSSHFDHVVEASAADSLTEMIMAYRLSQLIHVAARLEIADLLKGGARSCDELASRTGVHPHALYRVLRALASNGIFHLVSGGGQERTEAQYRTLFDASGFSLVKIHPASSSFSILEGVRS